MNKILNKFSSQFEVIEPSSNLEPFLSNQAVNIHFQFHHLKYVENLEKLAPNERSLFEIIRNYPKLQFPNIYNNAAQIINHNIFWQSMKLNTKNEEILNFLNKKINFTEDFKEKASKLFGSGWVWLVYQDKQLKIITTHDGDYPENSIPILNLDVWEHAYYVDYTNKRINFIDNYLNFLINWNLVESKFSEIGIKIND